MVMTVSTLRAPLRQHEPAWKKDHAFGVDPTRRERYSLRQARYDAAAEEVEALAAAAARAGRALEILDIGCKTGTLLRHLEPRPHFHALRLDGMDIAAHRMYKPYLYRDVFRCDLMAGCPSIAADRYDAVVCEQVLEHLAHIDAAIASIERILKPGGTAIIGVPVFIPPLAFLRRQFVAATLWRNPDMYWSHIQSFSLRTFTRAMRSHSTLRLEHVRGFRIASEGILMPLENLRWWWKLNRKLGEWLPSLCIEVQAIYRKPLTPA